MHAAWFSRELTTATLLHDTPSSTIQKLRRVQNNAARTILQALRRSDVNSLLQTALAACWTAHQLQAGRADVQDSADVISAVSEPAHLVAHQRTQHSIVICPTAVRAISTDIIRQTIGQHCRSSDLELTATCCVKLQLSLLSNPDLKLICFILLSANNSTHLFRQRLCSRLKALWRFRNFVLLLLLLSLLSLPPLTSFFGREGFPASSPCSVTLLGSPLEFFLAHDFLLSSSSAFWLATSSCMEAAQSFKSNTTV